MWLDESSSYVLVLPLAWLTAGTLKFLINSIRSKQLSFSKIGYGGFPSNHSAMVCAMSMMIALKEGINHPAFGVSLVLSLIVMMDAHSLRRVVGVHATRLNQLSYQKVPKEQPLRERMGHSKVEILGGAFLGVVVAFCLNFVLTF